MKPSITRIKTTVLLFSIVFSFYFPAVAKIYTWIDTNGQTHYSAAPPKGSKSSKEISIKNSTVVVEKDVVSKEDFSREEKLPTKTASIKNLPIIAKLQCLKALQSISNLTNAMGTKRPIEEAQKIKDIVNEINPTVTFKSISSCTSNYEHDFRYKTFTNCIADNNSFDALTCIASMGVTRKTTQLETKANKQCYVAIGIDRSIVLGMHSALKEKLKQGVISKKEYKIQRHPLTLQLKLIKSLNLSSCINDYNENLKNQEFINCYANSLGTKKCLKNSKNLNELGKTSKTLIEVSRGY